jgi:hypothetical protein
MSKMGLHDPFGHLKHKLWPNEGSRVKLSIWLLTTKSRELPKFVAFRWHATYCWKDLNEAYNFDLVFLLIEGLHTKLWASKVTGVLTLGISGFPFGSLEIKCHLCVGLVAKHKKYYKGEGGGFPQIWVVVNLVSSCLLLVCSCTKSVAAMH